MTRASEFFAAIRDLIQGTAGNRMRNWNPGGAQETLAQASAAQLEAESFRADTMYRNLFGITAAGADLDLRAGELGLARKPAQKATGWGRFVGTAGTAIPSGTHVATGDPRTEDGVVEYVSVGTAVVPQGETSIDAPVEAVVAGASGNASTGVVDTLVDTVNGISSVSNPAPITGGSDLESDTDLRARLALAPYRMAVGGPPRTWESLAMDVTGVAKASCIPNGAGPGTFKVVVWARDAYGELMPAGSTLVTAVDNLLQTYVLPGVLLTVAAATGMMQDVTVYIETDAFETDGPLVGAAIRALFPTAELVAAAIVEAGMAVGSVTDLRLGSPTSNVVVSEGDMYAGVIRVLPMEWDGHYL